ncbi:unnamed protein product [Boreogadus saida]
MQCETEGERLPQADLRTPVRPRPPPPTSSARLPYLSSTTPGTAKRENRAKVARQSQTSSLLAPPPRRWSELPADVRRTAESPGSSLKRPKTRVLPPTLPHPSPIHLTPPIALHLTHPHRPVASLTRRNTPL